MFRGMSLSYLFVIIILLILMGSATIYTLKECGLKSFLLGDGAFYAAYSGMCEE